MGSRLTQILKKDNHETVHLSRHPSLKSGVESYKWSIDKSEIDTRALEKIDAIVHLAGAGVADQKWSKARKRMLHSSRIDSTRLLFDALKNAGSKPKVLVSASGVGYYGTDTGNAWVTEENKGGTDFLAQLCRGWEAAADEVGTLGIRTVKLRIGVVLDEKGGALKKMVLPVQYGAGAPLGSGQQYMSWIHLDDLCRMIGHCIQNNEISGVFNAVSDDPKTNTAFTRSIARTLKKPLWLPNVPAFVLKLVFGKMSSIILGGNRVSNDQIKATGFTFKYSELDKALEQILRQH